MVEKSLPPVTSWTMDLRTATKVSEKALFGEGVEGFGEGHAGIDHDGELHGEVDEFFAFDAVLLPTMDGGDRRRRSVASVAPRAGGLDVDDVFAFGAEKFGGVGEGEGGDEAVDDLAALVAGLVGEAILQECDGHTVVIAMWPSEFLRRS